MTRLSIYRALPPALNDLVFFGLPQARGENGWFNDSDHMVQ